MTTVEGIVVSGLVLGTVINVLLSLIMITHLIRHSKEEDDDYPPPLPPKRKEDRTMWD